MYPESIPHPHFFSYCLRSGFVFSSGSRHWPSPDSRWSLSLLLSALIYQTHSSSQMCCPKLQLRLEKRSLQDITILVFKYLSSNSCHVQEGEDLLLWMEMKVRVESQEGRFPLDENNWQLRALPGLLKQADWLNVMPTQRAKPHFVQKAALGIPGLTHSASFEVSFIVSLSFHLYKTWMDSRTRGNGVGWGKVGRQSMLRALETWHAGLVPWSFLAMCLWMVI